MTKRGKRTGRSTIVVTGRQAKRLKAHRAGRTEPVVIVAPSSTKQGVSRELRQDVALLNTITAMKAAHDLASKQFDRDLTRYVRQARRLGVTWTRIGQAIGITQQSASERWGPYPPRATPKAPRGSKVGVTRQASKGRPETPPPVLSEATLPLP